MRTQLHQEAFPGEDISDRPPPEASVPGLLALIEGELPSGRYRARELVGASRRERAARFAAARPGSRRTSRRRRAALARDDVRLLVCDRRLGSIVDARALRDLPRFLAPATCSSSTSPPRSRRR